MNESFFKKPKPNISDTEKSRLKSKEFEEILKLEEEVGRRKKEIEILEERILTGEKIIEMGDFLKKKFKEHEIIANNRNFNIEIQESGLGVSIKLKHKEKGEKNLADFLPQRNFFIKDNYFHYNFPDKVGFPENIVKFRNFFISLFHEIGHAHEKQEHPIPKLELLKVKMKVIFTFLKHSSPLVRTVPEDEENFVGVAYHKKNGKEKIIFGLKVPSVEEMKSLIPEDFIGTLSSKRELLKMERNAWAFALNSLRQLERDGYNVFSGFEDFAQVRDYINCALYSYDLDSLSKKLDKSSTDLEEVKKYIKRPLFTKKNMFEESRLKKAENSLGIEKSEVGFEILKTPEISIREEREAQLLSFILKAKNPEWGNDDSPLSVDVKNYFSENPLNSEVSGFLDEIRALREEGVDEEVLYTLAFTYGHPERNEGAFELITKHKSYIENPQELQQKLFHMLEVFGQSFSSSQLAEKLNVEIEKDKKARGEISDETKARIEKLIAFFKPDSKTTGIRKVSLMPTDPLDRINTGSAFVFGEELVLKTHIDNPDNLEHEFSHSMINPIVEKLSQQLTDEQKEKISELASEELKQDYGKEYFSLLCEEFIRTYNDVFKKGEKPPSHYEALVRKIYGYSEEQFQKSLTQYESLKAMCEELGITTIEDFRNKFKEHLEKFEKNLLRDLIFEIYQEYSDRPDKETENFERFVLAKFSARI